MLPSPCFGRGKGKGLEIMGYPENIKALCCTVCGKEYPSSADLFVCPDHGNDGNLEVRYNYTLISKSISRESLAQETDFSQWRYRPLLPLLDETPRPELPVGWTPLVRGARLGAELGLDSVYIKDESRQPTGSLKDRASALAVMKAYEAGARVITTASTGNAAAALSGFCASAGLPCVIFVPESAPKAKVAQLLAYGATVFLVRGSYDQAFELCLQASKAFGWYNRNTGYNPYMAEGKKTAAYEICEQLDWQAPDQVFVSVGDGCIISGLHKGFRDMLALGWIDKMPKLMGVQSAGSDFMWQADSRQADVFTFPAISADTVADSISAGLPRDRVKASRAVRESGGAWIRVEDTEILAAIPRLASRTGIFGEPAAAASLAGLSQACDTGLTSKNDRVVLLVTGNGLKDADATMKACSLGANGPLLIGPDIDAVHENLPASLP